MPPRKKAASANTAAKPVGAITHDDKRVNIPTADAQDFVADSVRAPVALRFPRDPTLDPQLAWRGKDATDGEDLVVQAPPLYIQEKVDPRVLIENLRRTSDRTENEPELTLFDSFDGLPSSELASVEFYKHAANWSNRLILGDSLEVMGSLAERESLRGQVQMIYLDPPYGIKFRSNWQVTTSSTDVGDNVAGASREVEQIKAFRDTWELGIHSYLGYLRDRLVAIRDLLTASGSVFVQISDDNVHLVRSLLDEVFGAANFAGQIAFAKTTSSSSSKIASVFDYLLWYAKDESALKIRQIFELRPPIDNPNERYVCVETEEGEIVDLSRAQKEGKAPIPAGRILRLSDPTSQDPPSAPQPFEFGGRVFNAPSRRHWTVKWPEGMNKVKVAGMFHVVGNTLVWKNYRDQGSVKAINNIWTSLKPSGFGEANIYVVQTIKEVVERCVLMSTDPGDLVLDPTCGSGTTATVAEQWGRRWITIDTSRVALALARQRIMGARYPHYLLADSEEGRAKEAELSGVAPVASATGHDVRKGFVYKRVPRVTLKSIANNPDIVEGLSRMEIDAAIAKHAETVLLYDQPYPDDNKVRVAGPFTVESASPHRAFEDETKLPDSQSGLDGDSSATFEQMLLDNLELSGAQNGRKSQRFEFSGVERIPGKYVTARATPSPEMAAESAAISIGPRYGTVGADWVKAAAREAMKGAGHDVLLVLGFAFDPRTLEVVEEFKPDEGPGDQSSDGTAFAVQAESRLGGIRVLLVRMNPDLAMGETLLKKAKNANLFTVFGEPDILPPWWTDKGWQVTIRGFDVYNPVTGDVRAGTENEIAMWMIDTDYNEESFFVRHAYFLGSNPYERLKKALKAEIDEAAWESLNSATSRPFPHPSTGKIAIKVINHYGDELLTVLDLADPPAG